MRGFREEEYMKGRRKKERGEQEWGKDETKERECMRDERKRKVEYRMYRRDKK